MSDTHKTSIGVIHHNNETLMHPMVQAAMTKDGLDTQSLEKLMELQERYERNEAVKAFNAAMVELKRDLPAVIRHDSEVDFTSSKGRTYYTHATLAGAMDVVQPILTQHGFSMQWRTHNGKDFVSVKCVLAHRLGHEVETTLTAAPDGSGGKNSVQAVASTVTYLKRYTALSLLGVSTADMKDTQPAKQPSANDRADDGAIVTTVTGLRKMGLALKDAEGHIGKPSEEWTFGDINELRQWSKREVTNRQSPPEPSEPLVNDDGTVNEPPPFQSAGW